MNHTHLHHGIKESCIILQDSCMIWHDSGIFYTILCDYAKWSSNSVKIFWTSSVSCTFKRFQFIWYQSFQKLSNVFVNFRIKAEILILKTVLSPYNNVFLHLKWANFGYQQPFTRPCMETDKTAEYPFLFSIIRFNKCQDGDKSGVMA